MASSKIERIDYVDYTDNEKPVIIGSFFYSEETGLVCDNKFLMDELEDGGIIIPPGKERVFPKDGRKCFDSLKWRSSTFIGVTKPRFVDSMTS